MTDAPHRVQLSRAKGWRMPPDTVKVDRSTRWGNTYIVGSDFKTAEECIEHYQHDIDKAQCFRPHDYEAWIAPLRGKNLACWCALDKPCHAGVLLALANPPEARTP